MFDQLLLGPIYWLFLRLRRLAWIIRRPLLMGVRVLVVRQPLAAGAPTEVLLVRHRAGKAPWSLPGGGVERREALAVAARREVLEEAGLVVRVERLLGAYENFRDGVSNYIAVFVCVPLDSRQTPQPPRSLEIAEARFFSAASLPAGLEPGSRRRIAEYQAGEGGLARLW